MPIDRATLDEHVARLNRTRRPDQQVLVVAHDPARFTLSFPDRAMPEGQCIDQDFTDIQFDLHEHRKIFTSIVNGRQDEETRRYLIDYEVVEWD